MGSISWGKELAPSGRVHDLFSPVLRSVRDRDPVCSHSDQDDPPPHRAGSQGPPAIMVEWKLGAQKVTVAFIAISRLTQDPGFPKGLQE